MSISNTNFSDNGTAAYCVAPNIVNGYVYPLVSSIEQDQSYAVYCHAGYSIDGNNTMTCLNDGSLSSVPTCTGK